MKQVTLKLHRDNYRKDGDWVDVLDKDPKDDEYKWFGYFQIGDKFRIIHVVSSQYEFYDFDKALDSTRSTSFDGVNRYPVGVATVKKITTLKNDYVSVTFVF